MSKLLVRAKLDPQTHPVLVIGIDGAPRGHILRSNGGILAPGPVVQIPVYAIWVWIVVKHNWNRLRCVAVLHGCGVKPNLGPPLLCCGAPSNKRTIYGVLWAKPRTTIRVAALQATKEMYMVCCGLSRVRTINDVLPRSKQQSNNLWCVVG